MDWSVRLPSGMPSVQHCNNALQHPWTLLRAIIDSDIPFSGIKRQYRVAIPITSRYSSYISRSIKCWPQYYWYRKRYLCSNVPTVKVLVIDRIGRITKEGIVVPSFWRPTLMARIRGKDNKWDCSNKTSYIHGDTFALKLIFNSPLELQDRLYVPVTTSSPTYSKQT